MGNLSPSTQTVLETLTQSRLVEIGKSFAIDVPGRAKKDRQILELLRSKAFSMPELLTQMYRDELRRTCKVHGLDASGRKHADLAVRIQQAWRPGGTLIPLGQNATAEPTLSPGGLVAVRHRQYMIEEVVPPHAVNAKGTQDDEAEQTLVRLVCVDDDAPGQKLEVLWERELDARLISTHGDGLPIGRDISAIDPVHHFSAYLHAIKWSCVTATDASLFQAPFRAGISTLMHQLVPLKKALELPSVNLFIADDVGLGKTIEAGLIFEELLLRQRVQSSLIVCPAAVALQWRSEMERRFGIRFEIYNRAFVARREQERGFGVNPWTTYPHFIISYQTLRRPEYKEPLLRHLGEKSSSSLLILDEAHNAAPAAGSRYACDSNTTHVIRDIAPRFGHRLFLSATPHNGHSNSFSALLELLDSQRFTRGVPVTNRKQLEPVMVRRLKSELVATGQYPVRKIVQLELEHDGSSWRKPGRKSARQGKATTGIDLGKGSAAELELSTLLAEYSSLVCATSKRSRMVLINLQKRLLSSVEAFARTLEVHAQSVAAAMNHAQNTEAPGTDHDTDDEDEIYGPSDEALEEVRATSMAKLSSGLVVPDGRAAEVLEKMRSVAKKHRHAPGGKTLALVDWIRENLCSGAGKPSPRGKDRTWSDRRMIIFTEYADSLRYLEQVLASAIEGTDQSEERIRRFHGGMSDEEREELQAAFNGSPQAHPVRILLATDAAREGVNLQGYCADLFHFDVPWNPAKMEQRNGRIDRALQPSPEVRCHYFFYPQRKEDRVLSTLVTKVERIYSELGSLAPVVSERLATLLEENGVCEEAAGERYEDFSALATSPDETAEISALGAQPDVVAKENDAVGRQFERSRARIELDADILKEAVEAGLELAGAKPLEAVTLEIGAARETIDAFVLPELPSSWQRTLDTLRPPRRRDEEPWQWRAHPPLPVVFKAPQHLSSEVAHLHLEHPFVKRVLGRFLTQGFSSHDLSRVTILPREGRGTARAIAFGRLSLFGRGGSRLHEQLVVVAAERSSGANASERLTILEDVAEKEAAMELNRLFEGASRLKTRGKRGVPSAVTEMLTKESGEDFSKLWGTIAEEGEAAEKAARLKLEQRGTAEAEAMTKLLSTQKAAIEKQLKLSYTLLAKLESEGAPSRERKQLAGEIEHMKSRVAAIPDEAHHEAARIRASYEAPLRRLEPIGLVYLWPTA